MTKEQQLKFYFNLLAEIMQESLESSNRDWKIVGENLKILRKNRFMKTALSILSIKIEDNKTCSLYDSDFDQPKLKNLTPEQAAKIKGLVEEFYYLGIRRGHSHVVSAAQQLPFLKDE